jgi:hypothetical protein
VADGHCDEWAPTEPGRCSVTHTTLRTPVQNIGWHGGRASPIDGSALSPGSTPQPPSVTNGPSVVNAELAAHGQFYRPPKRIFHDERNVPQAPRPPAESGPEHRQTTHTTVRSPTRVRSIWNCGGLQAASRDTATGSDRARKRARCAAQKRRVRARGYGDGSKLPASFASSAADHAVPLIYGPARPDRL